MPYSAFTVEDFCKDPDFIRWATTPTDESDRFWRAFMVDYPHRATDVQTAVDYVRMIQFHEVDPSQQDLSQLKQRIWTDIDPHRRTIQSGTDPVPEPHRLTGRVVQWYQRPYWAAAAVVLLVASVSAGWWAWRANAELTYQTAYGKIQEVRLADGSVVTLNANSSLKVADNLMDSPVREVWLAGEAYFDVARRNGTRFVVHTADARVDVLGTEFNVNTRRERTNVVLHEGKVRLSTDDQPAVVMKPGDMATVVPKSKQIQLKRVQPDVYDAWKESYILLDGRSLPEIINALEDTFGVKIDLKNAQLADKKLTGKLRTDVAGDCIENLALILDADVTKSGDTYLFD